jgi:hypothetical protein
MKTTTKGVVWDVIAPAVRWPLYSTRRLAGVLVAVLVAVVIASNIGSSAEPRGSEPGESATAVNTPRSGAPSPLPSLSTALTSSAADADDETAAGTTATAFVRAWARPDLDQLTWWEGINETADEAFSQALGSTDPDNIPATKVTGTPTVRLIEGRAEVTVKTDGPTVLVVLVLDETGAWRVANLLPTNQPSQPPAKPKDKTKTKPKPRKNG